MSTIKAHYQNIIIGFGKGGKTLAAWLAGQSQEVAIIEQSPAMYGGSCINIACIPTKSLVNSAAAGIAYPAAHQIKDQLTALLRQKNYDKIAQSGTATVIDGKVSFLGPKKLQVLTKEETHQITADRIFINTGTRPAWPDIPGINGQSIYNSTTIMELPEIPAHLVIVGGGYVGLEFAAMFLKFGAKVTLIDRNQNFLPREDRDIAAAILQDLTSQGLQRISGATVTRFEQGDPKSHPEEVHTYYAEDNENQYLCSDGVLIATGRTPVTEDLNLSAAGIETTPNGYIKVDKSLQTTSSDTWAIGDVNGGPQFTYISLDDFRIVKNQLSSGNYTSVSQRKPYSTAVFINPSYARIGINETQARAQQPDITIFKLPAAAIPKAAILRQQEGLLKAVVDSSTGLILGCMLYCAQAHELINIIQLAMHNQVPYQQLRDNIYTHPTMAEAFNDLFAE